MSTTPWDVYKLILFFLIFLLALIYFSWQSLTAQGLSFAGNEPWTTTCSQVAPLDSLMVINNLLYFNFGGAFFLMEILHTASALHSGGCFLLLLLLCSPCPLWWSVACGIVWFTQLHSSMG